MARIDYFADQPLRVAALQRACTSWRRTPFVERSCVKGAAGGVDCAGFVGAVLFEIGAVPEAISVPPYEVNHAEHTNESVLRAWFEQPAVRRRVRRLDEDEPHVDGDIVFPIVGRCEHHLGLRIGNIVWHVVRPAGVCTMSIAQLLLAPGRYRLTA